ncbi:MAG: hypothetical protein AABX02_01340 [archaeon]
MVSPLRLTIQGLTKGLSPEQLAALGFPEKGTVEISKVQDKTWVISLPNGQTDFSPNPAFTITPIHQKVLRLLKTHHTPDLIEGRFERLLSPEELDAFTALLAAGKIECFKTNPKFDKGIYREVNPNAKKASIQSNPIPIPEKVAEEYSLMHDGFMVLRSDGAAKAASFDLAERIKAGEIKGIKSFDGFYYIIENSLLQKHTPRLLGLLQKEKTMDISQVAAQNGIPIVLARIALEFAKEDGVVIEKKKNMFAYVG